MMLNQNASCDKDRRGKRKRRPSESPLVGTSQHDRERGRKKRRKNGKQSRGLGPARRAWLCHPAAGPRRPRQAGPGVVPRRSCRPGCAPCSLALRGVPCPPNGNETSPRPASASASFRTTPGNPRRCPLTTTPSRTSPVGSGIRRSGLLETTPPYASITIASALWRRHSGDAHTIVQVKSLHTET